MAPGFRSDDPVNREAEQGLERPHGFVGFATKDTVDRDMRTVTPTVDLTLNGADGLAAFSLPHLDDQLRPSLLTDDPVDADPRED
jgi:hypothetical protein